MQFVTDTSDAVAEEEEEEIKGNVKGDQASVADSDTSANKLVRCTNDCLSCLQTADVSKLRESILTPCLCFSVAGLVLFQHAHF